MPERADEVVGIVGLGAVGGSLALTLSETLPVVAWSRDPRDRSDARKAGIDVRGDETTWGRAMDAATIIVIAVPLDAIAPVARELRAQVGDDVLMLHTGSLQRREALSLTDAEFARVIGTHPMAGSERSGFAAARADMFQGSIVRAEDRATEQQRERIERLWREAGCARVVWNNSVAHDALMARVSHLPQLLAVALGAALGDVGVRRDDLGPGARDMTRLASSDPSMWLPLLAQAPPETVDGIRRLTSALTELADAIERRDTSTVGKLLERGRAWRDGGDPP
jgi:prephenate dehydrogenase